MEERVGYKNTLIGLIPEDWDVEQLGNIIDFQGGSQPPLTNFISTIKDDYIRLLQIRDYKTDKYETYIPIKLARKFCTEDDIMIGRYGPPIFQILRGLAGAYNVALIKAVPSKQVDKEFIYHFLKQDVLLKFVEKLSQRSSGQTGIDLQQLKSYPVRLPYKSEQATIATALTDTDALIENIEKLLAKKRLIKQGTTQELFKSKVGWDLKRLGDIIEILTDYTANGSFESLKVNVKYYETKNYAVLVRTTDLDKTYFEPQRFTDKTGYDFLSKTALYGGEIVIANVGSIGKVFRVPFYDMPMTLAPNTYLLKFYQEIDEDYIYQWMLTKEFYSKLMSKIGSTTLQAINKDNLRSIELHLPKKKNEQTQIAQILIDMDNEIEALEKKLHKYRMIKQGMMQVLLTGKIRLI